ncbi:MAG TPA: hypothetical protein VMN82_15690 [Thermoanaerobaculia bacterium]|nr:hypothetical protein [Thermoanaerobaculia bacterium]
MTPGLDDANTASMPNDDSRLAEACGRCGCPLVGNEVYCSACGRRILSPNRRARLAAAAALGLAAAAAAGILRTSSCRESPAPSRAPVTTPIRSGR